MGGGAPERTRECPSTERLKCRIHNSLQPQPDTGVSRCRFRRAGARNTGGAPEAKKLSLWERDGRPCPPMAASIYSAITYHSRSARSRRPTRPGAHLCATRGEPLGEAADLARGVEQVLLMLPASASGD